MQCIAHCDRVIKETLLVLIYCITVTGKLYIKQNRVFNYEHNNLYTFTVRLKDNYHWSTDKVLTIEINDINEKPKFSPSSYTLNLDEETVRQSNYIL